MPTLHDATGPELTAAQLHDILRLRVDVFVVEQKAAYPELDGRDLKPDTRHLWFEGDEGVLAYLRVLLDPGDIRRIGRVATAANARGQGLAARLMDEALTVPGEYVLDAQTYVQGFYARYGFVAEGAEYTDEDGIPHIRMRRLPR
ncbi:GNAT family N-acetyltransferase [Amycolatopsis sp. SID8362]|uniref:GNAT family N-acetyltransferase n=1 Tax=Amycolatopsis sp. SID8362 TaxID=2690346 RepID=UPI001370A9FD|nr:GNAT family N-acetyltransferase [Amycolatopsis sp. SID8362]NBH06134.1 GNAT family N-acetyltransferase [Amycolatopsis sp. SID8362]NED42833.1 GNAT family N-acetyltransferase [Amycolatopsis sp. SID8362]